MRLPALAPSAPGEVAAPVIGMVRFGLEALLEIERSKLSLPADFGAKTTLNGTFWPADTVSGKFSPVTL